MKPVVITAFAAKMSTSLLPDERAGRLLSPMLRVGIGSLSAKYTPLRLGRSPSPYTGTALAVAVLVALLSAYVVWQVKATDYASSARASLNTARLLADNIGDSFNQLDALLQKIGEKAAGAGRPNDPDLRIGL